MLQWSAISLAICGLLFRSLVWASWLPYGDEPYGAADILDDLLKIELKSTSEDDDHVVTRLGNHLRDLYHVGFDVEVVATGALTVEQVKNRRYVDRRSLAPAGT
jgi:hypothetical protein